MEATVEKFVSETLKQILEGVKKVASESHKASDEATRLQDVEFDLSLYEEMKVHDVPAQGEVGNRIKFSIPIYVPVLE